MPRVLPPDSDGSLTAMAKGVNDVLNYYIQVSDTKASIFIAGSVAAATFLLMKFPTGAAARTLYFSAAAGLLDEEYSVLNFHTARILEKKIRILRVAILSFLAGILTALPHYLMNA